MYGKVYSAVLCGLEAALVEVEIDFRNGLPCFDMVGLLASEVREARERVRTALGNSGYLLPPMKITANLSPANLRKQGNSLDLPIAVAILIAMGCIPQETVQTLLFMGELGLEGQIRPIRGVLPILDSIRLSCPHITGFVIPKQNALEGRILGENIYCPDSLSELITALISPSLPDNLHISRLSFPVSSDTATPSDISCDGSEANKVLPDFADLVGQASLRRATEIAAAGMHNILYTGEPGSGKTLTARCIPSILPPMTLAEQLEVTKIYSAGGLLPPDCGRIMHRPFRSPHHSTTVQALTGGGTYPKPGEISYADRGVLFLDELPEFHREVIETLRQPMEDGTITITRANGTCIYPAHFMLAASRNPCPCGYYPDRSRCICSPSAIRRYQNRISGPILDRIDIFADAEPVSYYQITHISNDNQETDSPPENSASIRRRVLAAHELQKERYQHLEGILFNSQLNAALIRRFCTVTPEAEELLQKVYEEYRLSARSYHRILRVSRTIADLDNAPDITVKHLSEAIRYRNREGGMLP